MYDFQFCNLLVEISFHFFPVLNEIVAWLWPQEVFSKEPNRRWGRPSVAHNQNIALLFSFLVLSLLVLSCLTPSLPSPLLSSPLPPPSLLPSLPFLLFSFLFLFTHTSGWIEFLSVGSLFQTTCQNFFRRCVQFLENNWKLQGTCFLILKEPSMHLWKVEAITHNTGVLEVCFPKADLFQLLLFEAHLSYNTETYKNICFFSKLQKQHWAKISLYSRWLIPSVILK